MRTRSSLEYTIPRRRNRRRSRQQQEAIPIVDKFPIQMADDRPMAEQLQAPTGGFESAIVVPPINAQNFELKSSLINLVQNRIFRGGNDEEPHAHIRHFESITNNQSYNDQDSLNSLPVDIFLYIKSPTEGLQIIENKAKVRCSRNAVMRVSTNAPPSSSTSSSSNFEFQQMAAALEDKMTLTFRNEMNEMKNMMKALVPTPVPIKAVEERCTTCGSNHSFNVCPMTRGGYEYPVYHDNFQQFQQTASVGNFVQNGNSGYRPPNLANQIRPPGFNQQNNNRNVNANQGYNRTGNNGNQVNHGANSGLTQQAQAYQAPSTQVPVTYARFEAYTKANDVTLNNLQKNLMDSKESNKIFIMSKGILKYVAYCCKSKWEISMIVDLSCGRNIKQKEEVRKYDPIARRRACFTSNLENFRIIHQGRVIHSPQIASVGAISHIFPNNNLEDSFKMGDEDLNFIPNKELDKEDLIPIPRESKIGKECDFPLCDDFQSFKTFSNPLFEKKDDFPSRNDESILKEEVHKETLKSYLNPLFEDDEEIISIEVSRQISPKVNFEPSIESLPKDDFDNDDDLFEMDSNNDEWKRILYGEDFERMDSDSAKTKDFDKSSSSVFKSLSDKFEPGGSSYVCYEDFHVSDALFSTINEDKVFNPGILVDKNSKVHEQNVLPTCPPFF
ncbi:hypothetical protein Tco_0132089 [Tanacetum coccineum]